MLIFVIDIVVRIIPHWYDIDTGIYSTCNVTFTFVDVGIDDTVLLIPFVVPITDDYVLSDHPFVVVDTLLHYRCYGDAGRYVLLRYLFTFDCNSYCCTVRCLLRYSTCHYCCVIYCKFTLRYLFVTLRACLVFITRYVRVTRFPGGILR